MEILNKLQFRKHIARTKSRISVTIIIVILLAFFIGMHGGTPIEHGDNLAPKAKRTVRNYGNPKFFVYPALMIYMNASVYIVYEMVLHVLPDKLSKTLDKWPYRDIPGHLLTLLFSIIGALSVYGICFLLTESQLYSTIGSLLLITSPLWNANSHYITVDIPLSALCALAVFVLLHILEKKSEITVQHMVVMGILIGLAASAKYNGAVIAVAVIAAMAFRIRPLIKSIKMLAICGAISIVVFLMINPFILINFRDFLQDFLYASNLVAIGHP
jgi:dolichyl-phosphate-mannose--protein O-mannosyl transferase